MTLPVAHKEKIQARCERLKALYGKYRKEDDRRTKMGWGAVVSILIILAYIVNTQDMTDFSGTAGGTVALGGIVIFGLLWHGSRREASHLSSRHAKYFEATSDRLKGIGVGLSYDGERAYLLNEDGSVGSGFDPFDETSFE